MKAEVDREDLVERYVYAHRAMSKANKEGYSSDCIFYGGQISVLGLFFTDAETDAIDMEYGLG